MTKKKEKVIHPGTDHPGKSPEKPLTVCNYSNGSRSWRPVQVIVWAAVLSKPFWEKQSQYSTLTKSV